MDFGFYVLVQFGGDQRRTQNKSIRLSDSGIEWEDEIVLRVYYHLSAPSKAFDVVRLTVYASFELQPMLGNGQALYTSECRVEELDNGTNFIRFPPGKSRAAAPPSLLITVGRWYSNHPEVVPSGDDSNLDSEESLVLIRETDLGQEALLLYHNSYRREDLENAAQHFERALHNCSPTHQCRAAVLTDPTGANLERSPSRFIDRPLELRHSGHPDRPGDVTPARSNSDISLPRSRDGDEPFADEHFPEGSHERRAADLVLDNAEAMQSCKLWALNGYFDRPQQLINLSLHCGDAMKYIGNPVIFTTHYKINKKAWQLLPTRSPDRLPAVRTLVPALWRLFEIRGELEYLTELIELSEGALQAHARGTSRTVEQYFQSIIVLQSISSYLSPLEDMPA
ncbi:hypothetical protein EDC04DRAFT_2760469 [Pisolithus marmoratus]|nr:hypothetical protein EDC04DRAFT_2760469 [Pisolithus marmoratus]